MLMGAVLPGDVMAQRSPLTLDRAVDMALDANRDLRDATLGLEVARRQVREAWGSVYPSVNANATYTRNLTVPGTFMPRIFFDPDAGPDDLMLVRFGSDNMWNMSLRAEQPVFRAAAFIGVGAAGRYEALQQEVVRGRSQAVVARVHVSFYDVLLADEAVRLTESTVARIRQTLDETRRMERAGVASSYDVLRLEVELANVEPALRRARNHARAARRALAVELGVAELDSVDVAGTLAEVLGERAPVLNGAADETVVNDLVQNAMAHRSELRQLRLMESLRRAEMRAEQSEYLPQVSVFGTYSVAAQQSGGPVFFGSSDAQRSYGRQVGVMVTMPLFSGMQRPARVAQRRIAVEQIRTQLALVEDQVEHQVRTFVEQASEAGDRTAAQQLAVRQAQRGYEIAALQYREGISSTLELTDAENALRQSEFNYAEAVYDYLVARARLHEATGNMDSSDRALRGASSEVDR